jgi:hypothetical protein
LLLVNSTSPIPTYLIGEISWVASFIIASSNVGSVAISLILLASITFFS